MFNNNNNNNCVYISYATQDATMKIHITLDNGETITLDVEASNTIEHVKAIIHCMVAIPMYQQGLIFAGIELEDSHTLTSYDVEHGATDN